MNEEQVNALKEMGRTEGWKILQGLNIKQVDEYRRIATAKGITLEERAWYSALAQGREEAIDLTIWLENLYKTPSNILAP